MCITSKGKQIAKYSNSSFGKSNSQIIVRAKLDGKIFCSYFDIL
jgi:hypothetical protein